MLIFETILATLLFGGSVAYCGTRLYWQRVQEPGRHRPVP